MTPTDFHRRPEDMAKYGLFTLVCSALLAHLGVLEDVLHHENRLTVEDIWGDANTMLENVYKADITDLLQASALFLDGFKAQRRIRATINQDVSNIMDAIITQVETNAATWNYRCDVERWHKVGRDLARGFYAESPHSVTQQRLEQKASLGFECVLTGGLTPFGYRAARLAAGESRLSGVITIRFSLQDGFTNYLAYPFFFMHEYVSHIYAVQTGSTLFTDGWLLFGASAFLTQQDALSPPLHGRQIDAFERYLLPHITHGKAQEGYWDAKRAYVFLASHHPRCFQALMQDLAALTPLARISDADFLYTLLYHLNHHRDTLRQKLTSVDCPLVCPQHRKGQEIGPESFCMGAVAPLLFGEFTRSV